MGFRSALKFEENDSDQDDKNKTPQMIDPIPDGSFRLTFQNTDTKKKIKVSHKLKL